MGAEISANERLDALRKKAREGRDPTCADETLAYMLNMAREINCARVLEIGAGEGLTSVAFLLNGAGSVVAIENDPVRAAQARENFKLFGVEGRAELVEGDAGEVLPRLAGEFDLIFLDGPKVQYCAYFPHCKRLLRRGGALFSDDVLLYGWVRGEPPKKRRMLVAHIREYLDVLQSDPDFQTEILQLGEGLAVSRKL